MIIGSGFGGAAAAYSLICRGVRDILILEKEDAPGRHASGLNTAMARFVASNADQLPLVREGIRFLQGPPEGFPSGPFFRRCGSLMLAEGGEAEQLRGALGLWQRAGIPTRWIDAEEVVRLAPATQGGHFDGAIHCPEDGVADSARLLDAYLLAATAAGARLLTRRRVVSIVTAGGRISAVETEHERIETSTIVNAAGAWANQVAMLAGATPFPLRALKRHLVLTTAPEGFDSNGPFVRDMSHQLYVRPEAPGLLMSPCDSSEQPPGGVSVDPRALESLSSKLKQWLPRLANVSIGTAWAGLQTMTPDGNMVVGPDPRIRGFIWCAGLGGIGVATSAAVGRMTAAAVLGEPSLPAHAPGRMAA